MLAVGGVYAFLAAHVDDMPPLSWVLPRRSIDHAVVHFGARTTRVTDRAALNRLYRAAVGGDRPLPYATRCLPDDQLDWGRWCVEFVRRGKPPFRIVLGVADDCGTIYCEPLDRSYADCGGLIAEAARLSGVRASQAMDCYFRDVRIPQQKRRPAPEE